MTRGGPRRELIEKALTRLEKWLDEIVVFEVNEADLNYYRKLKEADLKLYEYLISKDDEQKILQTRIHDGTITKFKGAQAIKDFKAICGDTNDLYRHVNGEYITEPSVLNILFKHKLENLQILCPNCHSQTNTYAGKNKKTICH
jgi:hypothetical protein